MPSFVMTDVRHEQAEAKAATGSWSRQIGGSRQCPCPGREVRAPDNQPTRVNEDDYLAAEKMTGGFRSTPGGLSAAK